MHINHILCYNRDVGKGVEQMSIGKNIKKLRKSRGMTQQKLADLVGAKNYTTITKWESGGNYPQGRDLIKLSQLFNVSVDSLLGLDDKIDKMSDTSEYPYLPVSVAAGLPELIDPVTEEDVETIYLPDKLMGKWAGRDDIYIMRVNGESMNKTIPNHSLIAVKTTEVNELENGDIVVYSNHYEYSVKRFYKLEDQLVFRPHSTDIIFTDYRVPLDYCSELKIHGKVVMYIVNLD